MRFQVIVFLACYLLFAKSVFGQDSTKVKKVKVLPVPTFGYSPETRTYIGAVALFTINLYQDSTTRTSNAKVEVSYSWNKQVILETQWNYFFAHEAWFTRGLLHFSKYPDLYYGIGPDTQEDGELKFESNRAIVDVDVLKKFKKYVFGGIGIRYLNYSNLSFYNETNPYPELQNSSTTGVKLILLKDSRNNILNASSGSFMEVLNTHNFGDSYYSRLGIDLRKYMTMSYNDRHVLAGRFYTTFVFGDPAFFDYSLIGGDKYARGYFYGRYRDQNFTTLQLEYRMPIIWRIGLAGFGGFSMIYPDFTSIDQSSFKPNGGLGLRFLVDKAENTNLRIDYAVGSDGQDGFYITFGESF